ILDLQARIAAQHLILTLLGQVALRIDPELVEQRLRATRMMLQAAEAGRIEGIDQMTVRSLQIQIDLLRHVVGENEDGTRST
ncbi:MAG TPA: hypothetical protein VD929_07685, partial [Caulobacteraceae bacterium]|nr:hypothetical protein [Caulobacteraceae bacterium]